MGIQNLRYKKRGESGFHCSFFNMKLLIFVLIIVIAFNEAESASVEKRNADPQVNLGDVLALSIPKRNLQFQRGQPVRNVARAGARIRRVQAVSNIARTILSG